ncbi:MAG TPA: hypothetical protein DCL15_00065 [Chloroflexi bacterium]|nr:hypothetical protein [Chloroflexota bacterium]
MSVVLSWPGKRAAGIVAAAQPTPIERFEPQRFSALSTPQASFTNALYYGDNLPILAHLLDNGLAGQVRLIYADPPYDSGVTWTRKVRLRQSRQNGADPIVLEQPQYADAWPEGAYLQFIYDRLPQLRDLLAEDGALWLHCDHRRAHHLRCLLDEVFGAENYLNTITWRSQTARGAKVNAHYFPNSAHTILIYARKRAAPTRWRPPRKRIVLTEAEAAAQFMRDELGYFRTSDPGTYSFARLKALYAEGRLYAPHGGHVVIDESTQRVFPSNGGNLGVKYYLTRLGPDRYQVERAVDNVWDDIPGLGTTPGEDLGYPTQKTVALLTRILTTGSDPGDLVLDPFCGSGTLPAVAAQLGRRWIGCDANYGAIQTTIRRLQAQSAPFTVYAAAPLPQVAAPDVDLSITRIDNASATIEVALHAVRVPALSTGANPSGAAASWLALVDSVVIDPDYDGRLLRVTVADAPLKKRATIAGRYIVKAPALPTTIAVRILDITGGERLITKRIER